MSIKKPPSVSDGWFFEYWVLANEEDRNPGEEKAKDTTDDHFARTVTDALFETREFAFVNFAFELAYEHIEVATLITEDHADTECVVDDDEGEAGGDSENTGVDTLVVTDGGEERDGEGGMGARHVAVRESIAPVEAMLDRVDGKFDDLNEEGDDDRNKEDGELLKEIHSFI